MKRNLLIFSAFIFICIAVISVLIYAHNEVESASSRVVQSNVLLGEYGLVLGTSERNFLGGPNPYFYSRIDAAAMLYQAGTVTKLILSGGAQEVAEMKKAMKEKGVPSAHLVLDEEGVDTRRSIRNALKFTNNRPFVVVSQEFHTNRALYIARNLGVDLKTHVAEDPQNPVVMAREFLSRVKAVLINKFCEC